MLFQLRMQIDVLKKAVRDEQAEKAKFEVRSADTIKRLPHASGTSVSASYAPSVEP